MTDWDRKNLDALHSALSKKVNGDGSFGSATVSLIAIKNHIAMSFGHEQQTLNNCRTALCDVCRKNRMYECDVEAGWSPTCAFIKANQA